MKSYSNQILEKMKSNFYPSLGWDFIYNLSNESHRGSVLIGASKVEEQLEELLTLVLPRNTKKYKARLLNYPGSMSSFSSKIELSYAFRLIDSDLYNSLNILRRLRNDAAHSSKEFELGNIREQVDIINSFELGFDKVVSEIAFDNLIKMKKHQMAKAIEMAEVSEEMKKEILDNKYNALRDDPAVLDQLVIWKLAYGLTFISLKILAIRDDFQILENKEMTWVEIINNKSA